MDRELEITFYTEPLRNGSTYLSKGLKPTSSGGPPALSGLLLFTGKMKALGYTRVQVTGARASAVQLSPVTDITHWS